MFRQKDIKILVFGSIFLILSFFLDSLVHKFFLSLQNSLFTFFFEGISFISNFLAVGIILSFLFVLKRRYKTLSIFILSFFGLAVIVYTLKIFIARPRPSFGLEQGGDFSFPSGHASACFGAYPWIMKHFQKLRGIWIVFSLLAVVSRLYLGVHYFSDVLSGVILGYFVSRCI